MTEHLAWALHDSAWWGCSEGMGRNRRAANCYPTLEDIVSGDDVFADTRNVQPGKGRLYLNVHGNVDDDVHDDFTDEYSGGVETLTCRWAGKRSGEKPFLCYKYDAESAEGYQWLSGYPTGHKTRSPLALPFLSFTYPQSDGEAKHMVFMKEDTGYGRDLIAAVPVGTDVRKGPADTAHGWWHIDQIDGSSVEVEEW